MKDKNILIDVVSDIDDDLIINAEPKAVTTFLARRKWIPFAACICIAALTVTAALIGKGKSNALPIIDFEISESSAAGPYAVETDDINSYISANPWNEDMNIQALPVYLNTGYTAYPAELLLSEDRMLSLAEEIAAKLGYTSLSHVSHWFDMGIVTTNSPIEVDDIASVTLKADLADITVSSSAEVTVKFIEPQTLPEGYSLSFDGDTAIACDTVSYLIEEYGNITGLDNLQPEIKPLFADEYLLYFAFSDGDDDISDILGYAFGRCEFIGDKTSLMSIKWNLRSQFAEYLGEYDIISSQEAKQMLTSGKFIIGSESPDESDISAYELIYRYSSSDKYFMPYYRFYVKNDALSKIGKSVFYYYDVPAIELKYFESEDIFQ